MKKAIIFDLDGTLLNTDLLIKKSFIHTFKKYKPGYTLSNRILLPDNRSCRASHSRNFC